MRITESGQWLLNSTDSVLPVPRTAHTTFANFEGPIWSSSTHTVLQQQALYAATVHIEVLEVEVPQLRPTARPSSEVEEWDAEISFQPEIG